MHERSVSLSRGGGGGPQSPFDSADWPDVALIALATVAYSTVALLILPADPSWQRAALAFAMSAFFVGLAVETVRRLPDDRSLLYCSLGMGLAFLTIGFPLLTGTLVPPTITLVFECFDFSLAVDTLSD